MFNSELSVCQSVFLWIILSQQVKAFTVKHPQEVLLYSISPLNKTKQSTTTGCNYWVKQKVSEPSVESDRSLTWWRQTGEDGGRVGGETGWDRHAGGAVLKFKLIDFIYLFIY